MSTLGGVIGTMTLDDFKLWSSQALKVYLSLRGKPTTGSSDTLAARLVKKYNHYYVTWFGSSLICRYIVIVIFTFSSKKIQQTDGVIELAS